MVIACQLIRCLQNSKPKEAWVKILANAWDICSQPLNKEKAEAEVTRRDRTIGEIDHYLATAGWDLWAEFENSVPFTSKVLADWWAAKSGGKAILILDALSLREVPWLLAGANDHEFTIKSAKTTCGELPADTTPFAKALGFAQRSSLNNNGAGRAHKLIGACTESVDIAWQDCANMVGSEPNWVFWHHWPDHRLHAHDDPGKGLSSLTQEVMEQLTSDEFWNLVERLATGRRLIITSDHGYAASGLFPDSVKEQTEYLKKTFKSGRWCTSSKEAGAWVPPIDLSLESRHGIHLFVNGRRKWKSSGGYPTLTHGGLSILEVLVPLIELSKG